MPDYFSPADWAKAKAKAHEDENFKKSASGIDSQLKKVKALMDGIKNKTTCTKTVVEMKKLRVLAAKALTVATKAQKSRSKLPDAAADKKVQMTYNVYMAYLTNMIEAIDRQTTTYINLIKEHFGDKEAGKSEVKRKREPDSLTLAGIMANKKMLAIFRQYCQKGHRDNFEFYKDVTVGGNRAPSQKLYDRYFRKGAPLELNVDSQVFEEWAEAAEAGDFSTIRMGDTIELIKGYLEGQALAPLQADRANLKAWVDALCSV